MRSVHVLATRVAVTSTREARKAEEICETLKPDALQLNYYTPKLIHRLRRRHPSTRLILATGISDGSSLEAAGVSVGYSDAVLADTPSYTETGGTGKVHDWRLTAKLRSAIYPHPLILAGGLTPGNVKAAIDAVKPFAVDVSTGVERKVGVKDHRKIMEFITNAKGLPS
jgi:phosphoribosylanthranilate isomerase